MQQGHPSLWSGICNWLAHVGVAWKEPSGSKVVLTERIFSALLFFTPLLLWWAVVCLGEALTWRVFLACTLPIFCSVNAGLCVLHIAFSLPWGIWKKIAAFKLCYCSSSIRLLPNQTVRLGISSQPTRYLNVHYVAFYTICCVCNLLCTNTLWGQDNFF